MKYLVESFVKSDNGSWKLEPPTAEELSALLEAVGEHEEVLLVVASPSKFYLINRTKIKVKVKVNDE